MRFAAELQFISCCLGTPCDIRKTKGLLRPGNISTGGVDAITAQIENGKAKVFLNDFTTPDVGKGEKTTHENWGRELDRKSVV